MKQNSLNELSVRPIFRPMSIRRQVNIILPDANSLVNELEM